MRNGFIKRENMNDQKGYEVIIDGKKYIINDQFITGMAIKRIAGITEKEEQIASAVYNDPDPRNDNDKGWFAFIPDSGHPKFEGEDVKIGDREEVDILEEDGSQREFYTACNGIYILETEKEER